MSADSSSFIGEEIEMAFSVSLKLRDGEALELRRMKRQSLLASSDDDDSMEQPER